MPREWEDAGLAGMLPPDATVLVEWPSRVASILPSAGPRAGARRSTRPAADGRCGSRALGARGERCSRRPDRRLAGRLTVVSHARRRVLRWMLVPGAPARSPMPAWPALRVASARLWPAHEYTRLILESPVPLAHELITLAQPDRIVRRPARRRRAGRPRAAAGARAARRSVRRRASASAARAPTCCASCSTSRPRSCPQIFALPPVAEFGHRLVLDLYPPRAARSADGAARGRAPQGRARRSAAGSTRRRRPEPVAEPPGPRAEAPRAGTAPVRRRLPATPRLRPAAQPRRATRCVPMRRAPTRCAPSRAPTRRGPTPHASRIAAAARAQAHHRDRPRPRRRGPGRDRAPRHVREERRARDRAAPEGHPRRRPEHARVC